MKVGLGLPSHIPGTAGATIIEWARQADVGPFSSLATIDRVAYGNYEPLISLAAAAAVTDRVRLVTTVLLAPLRNVGILAKQAASLDALSGGRLTLGVSVGGREDDYRAAPAPFPGRGRRLDEQLALMKLIWSGSAPVDGAGSLGPLPVQPGGPELLIGGFSPATARRLARFGDGYIASGDPASSLSLFRTAEKAWQAERRSGSPRFVATAYFALGPNTSDRGMAYLRDYYGFLGPVADQIAGELLCSPATVCATIGQYREIGVDELILWPTVADLDQVARLGNLVG